MSIGKEMLGSAMQKLNVDKLYDEYYEMSLDGSGKSVNRDASEEDILNQIFSLYPITDQAKKIIRENTTIEINTDKKFVDDSGGGTEIKDNPKNKVTIGDLDTNTVLHELIHSWEDRVPFSLKTFQRAWDIEKANGNKLIKLIDTFLDQDPNYTSEKRTRDMIFERHAYLGAALAIGGIKQFPVNLVQYYSKLIK